MTMPSSVCDRLGVDGWEVPRAGYGELRRLRRVVRSAPGVPGVPPGLSSGISMAAGLDAGLETGDTDIECWLAGSLEPLPSSGETTIPAPAFISVHQRKELLLVRPTKVWRGGGRYEREGAATLGEGRGQRYPRKRANDFFRCKSKCKFDVRLYARMKGSSARSSTASARV